MPVSPPPSTAVEPAEAAAAAAAGPLIAVAEGEAGIRLDRWFQRHYPHIGYATLQSWLRKGLIKIDGHRAKGPERLETGQQIRVPRSSEAPAGSSAAKPAAAAPGRPGIDLRRHLLYQDDELLVLDKPAGLAAQGGSKLAFHLESFTRELARGGEPPRLVHRLDKDTSGVLVMARSARSAARLAEAFREGTVRKLYWAVVTGVPAEAEGRIDLPLAKHGTVEGERIVVDEVDGRPAVSRFRRVAKFGKAAAWLALEPLTGRTHQLRVHCAAIGHAILGDRKYGSADDLLPGFDLGPGLHLHARALCLPHPAGGVLTVSAPLPPHMRVSWRTLGFDEDEPGADLEEDARERPRKQPAGKATPQAARIRTARPRPGPSARSRRRGD